MKERTPIAVPKGVTIVDADQFQVRDGVYVFPFVRRDPTPGGQNLGVIEWSVEPIQARRLMDKRPWYEWLLVGPSQTRDPRYPPGVLYQIPCWVDSLVSTTFGGQWSYFGGVWRVGPCREHKTTCFEAYPPEGTSSLVVDVFVSSARLYFE